MNREEIKKAATIFACQEYMVGDIDFDALKKGFIYGVEWRINSVWHDGKEKAAREEEEILLEAEDNGGKSAVIVIVLAKLIPYYKTIRWAYIKDLVPEKKGGNKMKIFICISILVAGLLFVGQAQISFKPFSFSLPYWHRALGMLLLVLALVVYNVGEYRKGYKDGLNDGLKAKILELYFKQQEETK